MDTKTPNTRSVFEHIFTVVTRTYLVNQISIKRNLIKSLREYLEGEGINHLSLSCQSFFFLSGQSSSSSQSFMVQYYLKKFVEILRWVTSGKRSHHLFIPLIIGLSVPGSRDLRLSDIKRFVISGIGQQES